MPADTATLRYRLLDEADELRRAIMANDLMEMIDGMCDLLYVTFGLAEAVGIVDLQPFFDEVHRTNMLKVPEHQDRFGKVLKGPGWEPPRIAEMLQRLGYDAAIQQLSDDPSEWEVPAMEETEEA
jgi:predicted HAD superfamily Cof-like phosphohydrolase